ncbi:hypothetical protein NADFUDRAFT_39559 [Nadsonia fulvescens var. elongata DSM 6958]|uniref:Uncharacterized protein n=1 Tax=Nadsonia fulvescens var. elongata DSM 6958 TaxID=857566 RepID=A0A1E3PRW3_9ASCO|nr:hypothetical protein NADFUDRAFT_39559 [Nadsonia fulvescens var. elongata DSM 6958]
MTSLDGNVAGQVSADRLVSAVPGADLVDDQASNETIGKKTKKSQAKDHSTSLETNKTAAPLPDGDLAVINPHNENELKDKLEFINMFSAGGISRSKPPPPRINIAAATAASVQQPATMKNLALHCVSPGLSIPSSTTTVASNGDKQLRDTYLKSRSIEAKQRRLISKMARSVVNKPHGTWKDDMVLSVSGDEPVIVTKPISSLSSTPGSTTNIVSNSELSPTSAGIAIPTEKSAPVSTAATITSANTDAEPITTAAKPDLSLAPVSNKSVAQSSEIPPESTSAPASISASQSASAQPESITPESTATELKIPPSYANRPRSLRPRRFPRPQNIQVYPFTNQFASSHNPVIHSAPINGPSHIYGLAPPLVSTPTSTLIPIPSTASTPTTHFSGPQTLYTSGFDFNNLSNVNQGLAFTRGFNGPAPKSSGILTESNRFPSAQYPPHLQHNASHIILNNGRIPSSTISIPLSSTSSTALSSSSAVHTASLSPSSISSLASPSSVSSSRLAGQGPGDHLSKKIKFSSIPPSSSMHRDLNHSQSLDSLKQCMVSNLVHSLSPSVKNPATTIAGDDTGRSTEENIDNSNNTNIGEGDSLDAALQKKKRFLYLCSEMWDLFHP